MKYTKDSVDVSNQENAKLAYAENMSNVIVPQDPEMKKFLEAVEKVTNNRLLSNHRIRVPNAFVLTTIVVEYLQCLIEGFASQKDRAIKGEQVYMNFMDLLEMSISHVTIDDGEKDGNLHLKIIPGVEAKLLIKGDNVTEEE